jgi:hypothetical protein
MTDPRRKVSVKQERDVARRNGAKQHRGSGSGRRSNDMHTEITLVECKTVLDGNTQITIKASDLRSLAHRAALIDRTPELHIRLKAAAPRRDWTLIPSEDLDELHETVQELLMQMYDIEWIRWQLRQLEEKIDDV